MKIEACASGHRIAENYCRLSLCQLFQVGLVSRFVVSMAQVGTVWSVTAMPSGDIAAGTSDGVVRVFSRAAERQAEQALQDVRQTAFPAVRLLTSSRAGI